MRCSGHHDAPQTSTIHRANNPKMIWQQLKNEHDIELGHSVTIVSRSSPGSDEIATMRSIVFCKFKRLDFTLVTLCPGTFATVFGGFCRQNLRQLRPGVPCISHLPMCSTNTVGSSLASASITPTPTPACSASQHLAPMPRSRACWTLCYEFAALGSESGWARLKEEEVQRAKNQLRSNLLMNLKSRMG